MVSLAWLNGVDLWRNGGPRGGLTGNIAPRKHAEQCVVLSVCVSRLIYGTGRTSIECRVWPTTNERSPRARNASELWLSLFPDIEETISAYAPLTLPHNDVTFRFQTRRSHLGASGRCCLCSSIRNE